MRTFINIIAEGSIAQPAHWLGHLHQAVDAAQCGFYWEEGGCWGMALAIYDELVDSGLEPEIVVMTGFVHAMVKLDGAYFDYSGRTSAPHGPTVTVDAMALIALAVENGCDETEVMADRDYAADLIQNAKELEQQTH